MCVAQRGEIDVLDRFRRSEVALGNGGCAAIRLRSGPTLAGRVEAHAVDDPSRLDVESRHLQASLVLAGAGKLGANVDLGGAAAVSQICVLEVARPPTAGLPRQEPESIDQVALARVVLADEERYVRAETEDALIAAAE